MRDLGILLVSDGIIRKTRRLMIGFRRFLPENERMSRVFKDYRTELKDYPKTIELAAPKPS
ncbi:hypothetical protein BHE18_18180 [Rossellomorea aquimaris]|uniref:Uncharacterized protein n=1 Tax=Rossellomorea aquimaris TaxID=189382 RepID=A0A1J6VWW6_9BACI|nr:hypothetical protein BHE18_18180 [Rossellomorea aquimaris]